MNARNIIIVLGLWLIVLVHSAWQKSEINHYKKSAEVWEETANLWQRSSTKWEAVSGLWERQAKECARVR